MRDFEPIKSSYGGCHYIFLQGLTSPFVVGTISSSRTKFWSRICPGCKREWGLSSGKNFLASFPPSDPPWHLLPSFPWPLSLLTPLWFGGIQAKEIAWTEARMCSAGKTHRPYQAMCGFVNMLCFLSLLYVFIRRPLLKRNVWHHSQHHPREE